MAQGSQYQWLDYGKPVFPYKSYTSPVDETPHFILGAQNILASQVGYCEKRPGFSTALETVLSTLPGTVTRLFTWRRWGGSFFVMASTLVSGVAKVYKYQVGTDASFVLVWTSASAVSFDFVVANNFCYFGNSTDMKKYDGTTVSKWGCDAPGFAPTIDLLTSSLPAGMSFSSGLLSGTPTVVGTLLLTLTATDSAGNTVTQAFNFEVDAPTVKITTPGLPYGERSSAYTSSVAANYGSPAYVFTVFSGSLPTGLSLSSGGAITGTPSAAGNFNFAVQVTDSLSHVDIKPFNIYIETAATPITFSGGAPVGTVGVSYTASITAAGGTGPYTFSYIPDPFDGHSPFSSPDLPQGLSLTVASPTATFSGTPSNSGFFFVYLIAADSAGNTAVKQVQIEIDPTTLSFVQSTLPTAYQGFSYSNNFTLTGPMTLPITWTITAGSLNGQTGYVYGYSYTTVYGHESNVSPLSDDTGIFTGLDPAVTVIASSDAQVDGINLYRTTDGGTQDPSIMRLVAQLSNTNQTYVDSTLDVNLSSQTGPGFLVNTPPTPTIGFVWSNGRIYGFVTNTTYYSGAEEVSNGIAEEAWPSGLDGNYYTWPSEVGGMAVTSNGVDIGLSEQYWQISGDTLDTFRKSLLLDKAGTRSPTCISSVGDSVQWVDTAKQVWSSSLGEFGESIRTDLTTIDPSQTYIGYHKSGTYNWVYLLDALNGKLFTYDLDLDQWNTPWTISATAITSGEIALGQLALLVAVNGHVMVITPSTYVDDGVVYEDDAKLGLLAISPGRTTTGRSKVEPTQVQEIDFEMNATAGIMPLPSFVGQVSDDDPVAVVKSEWTDITANWVAPQFIPIGLSLGQARYICDSNTDPGIRTAVWLQWAAASVGWRLYSFTIGWTETS